MSEVSEKEIAAARKAAGLTFTGTWLDNMVIAALEAAANARTEASDQYKNVEPGKSWNAAYSSNARAEAVGVRELRALDAYRFYIDASEDELRDKGITRAEALAQARALDPYDGVTPSALANPAVPEGVERAAENIARNAYEKRLGQGSWAKEDDPYVRHIWLDRAHEAIRLVEAAGYMIAAAEKEAR